jgi:hypothetical protein
MHGGTFDLDVLSVEGRREGDDLGKSLENQGQKGEGGQ